MIKECSNTEIVSLIGKRLRQYRLNLAVTQKEMAQSTGISLPTIQKLESGRASNITLFNLLIIMRYLGIIENVDSLVPEQPESPYQLTRQRVRHEKQ